VGLVGNGLETSEVNPMELLELVAKLGEIALVQHEMEHKALEKAAVLVEKRAKKKIGEYQEQAGPFVGWAELSENTLHGGYANGFRYPGKIELGYATDEEHNPLLRTGDMRDSIEHVVADGEAQVGSNSDIAVYQELGTTTIPPRSFLGGAAVESLDEIITIVGEDAVAALIGKGVHGGKMLIEK
jgi:phage gpG-like protein